MGVAAFLLSDGPAPAAGVDAATASPVRSSAVGSSPVHYPVSSYLIEGSTAIPPDRLQALMRPATGPGVTLSDIRQGLVRLQEAYRELGFAGAAVTLPRQEIGSGPVRIRVVESPGNPPAAADRAPGVASARQGGYSLRHFRVEGNSALSAAEIDSILGGLATPGVDEARIAEALSRLRDAYVARGFTRARVSVPGQILTDGEVRVVVVEGRTQAAEDAALVPAPKEPAPVPPPRVFEVRRYEVTGNTLLKQEQIDQILAPGTGTNVSFAAIQKVIGDLQLSYRERGFATVSVGLPRQQITNAVVKVQVTEGLVNEIRITGNRNFSTNNIARALPSLRTNTPLNSRVFQRELDVANQNRDRQIYPALGPGPEPGTSVLTLRVKDRLPLHGRIEVNNQSTPGTPDWRVNSSLQYNNLWQHEHQVGLSYGFTPEAFKTEGAVNDRFFNRPLIANYGLYYRLPFGTADAVAEQVARSAGRFGYDEATRQFRLPPAGSRPDFTVFASSSSSDTGVKLTVPELVSQAPLLTVYSQDAGRNVTINDSVGGRFNLPFAITDTRRVAVSAGFDVKRFELASYNTNTFLVTTVNTNQQGSQVLESKVLSPQPVRRQELNYVPLSVGVDYSQADAGGTFSASLGLAWNFIGDSMESSSPTNSVESSLRYSRATLALTRDQRVFKDWSLLLRATAQLSGDSLVSNEQFALGGVGSVRGYYEGDQYGDAGWFGSAELRTPFIRTGIPIWSGSAPVWLRGSAFLDAGQRFLLDAPRGSDPTEALLGAGLGVSASINNRLDLRIVVAWPIRESSNTGINDPRAYFSLGGQF